ncbi:hypothetical protein D3C78_966410 [compost metagenome]
MQRITISFVFTNHTHKALYQFNCNLVNTIIIVTIAREFAFNYEVNSDTLFVTDRFNFSIFDSAQGVSSYRQAGDTTSHCAKNITVMKRHFNAFVAIFIVHVVDNIQSIYIQFSEPFHHWSEAFHNFVVIKVFSSNWQKLWANLSA